jgi:hypothetical protein
MTQNKKEKRKEKPSSSTYHPPYFFSPRYCDPTAAFEEELLEPAHIT